MISDFKELKRKLKQDVPSSKKLKIALLGDTATQFLAIAIQGICIERGYQVKIFEADYNQIESQFLHSSSTLHQFDADYIIVFQSSHKLLSKFNARTLSEKIDLANDRMAFLKIISKATNSKLIYFNYPEIEDAVFGSYANKIEHSFTYQIRKLNYELMNYSQENSNFFICDIAALQNKFGRNILFDSSMYINTEMVFTLEILPYIASRAIDIITSLEGSSKKCLVLDLDNTIWGGIIGDDGLENIQLGALGIGKTFVEFQYWIKKLQERGIIVAVCSKNDEVVAKEPFLEHPDMVLRLEDISVFIANWENKANNILQIQKILNIGLDSMVFLDDNPFERNSVRENLPTLCIPDLPEDPANYLEYLYALNLFETTSYSDEDVNRTNLYQAESKRHEIQKTFTNEVDFLKTLHMVSKVEALHKFNIPRVAQLSQRSNQFNLRTVRYTEHEIKNLAENDDYIVRIFNLKDKYGDHGLICVIILQKLNDTELFIDTWFMSCRVLKRGMENFVLNKIVNFAKEHQYENIVGEYIPTSKNQMVANHFQQLGFVPRTGTVNNLYELNINNYSTLECYIIEQ